MKRAVWTVAALALLAGIHFLMLDAVIENGVASALLSPGPHLPLEVTGLALAFVVVRLGLYLLGPAMLVLALGSYRSPRGG